MDRIPILKIGDVLLVSIQVDLEDKSAVALQEDLAERIVATGAHGVVIDITALEIVDSFIGRMISTVAAISKVLDADTVVVGMRPAVAITLVELDLSRWPASFRPVRRCSPARGSSRCARSLPGGHRAVRSTS